MLWLTSSVEAHRTVHLIYIKPQMQPVHGDKGWCYPSKSPPSSAVVDCANEMVQVV